MGQKGKTPKELEEWFLNDENFDRIAPHLESLGVTPQRYIRLAILSATESPKLRECDPWTIAFALIEAASLKLEPNGVLGLAYLVPYWNNNRKRFDAKLQIGYQGLCDLVYRSGKVSSIYARAIFERDNYDIVDGTSGSITHRPYIPPPGADPTKMNLDDEDQDRGPIVAVYSVAAMVNGGVVWEWMPIGEVEKIRRGAASSKGFSPWDSNYQAMARKTVLRRNCWRNLPMDTAGRAAVAMDQRIEGGDPISLAQIDSDLLPSGVLDDIPQQEEKKKAGGIEGLKQKTFSKKRIEEVKKLAESHARTDEIDDIELCVEMGDAAALQDWVDELKSRAS